MGIVRRTIYRNAPEKARLIYWVRRHSPSWIRAGVVFIHIPKAAGTSMNMALYGKFMGHFTASDVKRWASGDVAKLPFFALTRNPWDRLVSAYRFLKRGEGIGGSKPVNRPEQYAIPEFETFERFVRDWLAGKDLTRLDYVLQPQSRFVCDRNGKLIVDHVGRVENLEPTLDFLRSNIGHVPEVSRLNRSGDAFDYRTFYTPSLAGLVAQLYARDIELFDYDF